MKELVVYIHGKGGCAGESEHYKMLFPDCEVIDLDYQTFTPWKTGKEIREAVMKLNAKYDSIVLGVIGLSLVVVPPARVWALTEKWKTKDGSQPSKGYAVLMRVLGAVFALVGGMLIKWAVK